MREWATKALAGMPLAESDYGYLLGRGARPDTIHGLGISTWVPPKEPAPDEAFRKKYGSRGEFFNDRILFPLWSARGLLIGWESRHAGQKDLSRYIIPKWHWQTHWLGMPLAMPRMWEGKVVWICEGVFDLFALNQALPNSPVLAIGTARLHRGQVRFLSRLARGGVRLALDRDKAGREGTEKALYYLEKAGVECKDHPYGPGKDPGEIWDSSGLRGCEKAFPLAA